MESKVVPVNAIRPIGVRELRSAKLFDYTQLIERLHNKAKEHGRDPLEDVCLIISIYHTQGTNIDKIMEIPQTSDIVKKNITLLKSIYGLESCSQSSECVPTLSRVAEAFPHVSLVIADMLNSAAGGSRLRFCVTPKDLGAEVHFHFKMNYFSCLIDIDAGWKAQIALLVHNLCHSKGIMNTGGAKSIGAAFASSCKISARMMELRLAPASSRIKFTQYIIESFNFDAVSLNLLWNQVIGETKIYLCGTLLTPFHEQILNQQPLTLSKWREILQQFGSA